MFGVETGVRGSPPGRDPERIGVTAVQNRFVKQVLRQSLPRPLSRISSFIQQRTPNIISQKKFSYLFYIIQCFLISCFSILFLSLLHPQKVQAQTEAQMGALKKGFPEKGPRKTQQASRQ